MSLDINNFLNNVKKVAVDAVEATKPFAYFCGTVSSDDPLKIQIDQKFELNDDDEQLILTTLVSGNLCLKKDEMVILLRIQGGQKFIVLDRIGGVS